MTDPRDPSPSRATADSGPADGTWSSPPSPPAPAWPPPAAAGEEHGAAPRGDALPEGPARWPVADGDGPRGPGPFHTPPVWPDAGTARLTSAPFLPRHTAPAAGSVTSAPFDGMAGGGPVDVLAAPQPTRGGRGGRGRRLGWLVAAAGAVVVVLVAAGTTYAVRSLSGGGAQPEEVLPADAVAFVKVDLDPPAGQKIDALRFLRQFPALKDKVGGDDLRKAVFELGADALDLGSVDYARDVEPWLGSRAAFALRPSPDGGGPDAGDDPEATAGDPVVALAVNDRDKADGALRRLTAGHDAGYTLVDGWALLAGSTAAAEDAAADGAKDSLGESSAFRDDVEALGKTGVATMWADAARAEALLPLGSGLLADGATRQGRVVASLRFDGPDAVELVAQVRGGTAAVPAPDTPVSLLGGLPATTAVAVDVAGANGVVRGLYAGASRSLAGFGLADPAEVAAETGLDLPGDLETLAGAEVVGALDGDGLGALFEPGTRLRLGLRATTDPTRAAAVLRRLDRALARAGKGAIAHRTTADGYTLASDPAYAGALAGTAKGGTLGDRPAFRAALPDLAGAYVAAYVDGAALARLARDDGPDAGNLAPVAAIGMTATYDGRGNGSARFRLVTR